MQGNPRWNRRMRCYVNRHNTPIIYVDGACRYNGTPDAISAVGIWISESEQYRSASESNQVTLIFKLFIYMIYYSTTNTVFQLRQ